MVFLDTLKAGYLDDLTRSKGEHMTEEYVRGSITFDSDHLGPMTTIVPDRWSLLLVVSGQRASNAKSTDYEV